MLDVLKSILVGLMVSVVWYKIQIRRNKWYIIPFVFDLIFWPVKVLLSYLLYAIPKCREFMTKIFDEVLEEVESELE